MAITLVYFYLSFVGLIYQSSHLKAFGVSLFNFSTTSDYLVAFLKAMPFLLIFIFIHVLILVKDVIFNQKNAPGETFKERCYSLLIASRKLELVILILSLPVFAWMAGDLQGKGLSGHSLIKIHATSDENLGISQTVYLFDTTYEYVFLANESSRFVLKRDKVPILEVVGSNKSMQPKAEASAD
mgnify:CR=1 FL=1